MFCFYLSGFYCSFYFSLFDEVFLDSIYSLSVSSTLSVDLVLWANLVLPLRWLCNCLLLGDNTTKALFLLVAGDLGEMSSFGDFILLLGDTMA